MSKISDDYLNSIKRELDKGNNFVDYFAVIGLKTDVIFSDWLYESDITELNSTHAEDLNPDILSKFPPFDKTTISIDEGMIKVLSIT